MKVCWQEPDGRWMSSGGFPLQMGAIASLFDEMVLVVVRGVPQPGGLPLPANARVVPLTSPRGVDLRRKLSVLARSPYYLWRIGASMRGVDAVHVPLPGDLPLLALITAALARKHVIARYGGSWWPNAETTAMDRFTKRCMRRLASRNGRRNVMLATGDDGTAPAPGMSWIFSTALSRSELQAIRPCLDRALADPPRLVYVGRLSVEKGVAHLLRALASLAQVRSCPLPRLTVIGDGPDRSRLEALARELGCEQIVTFTGQLARERLAVELGRADLCVQPSLTEGFSKAWLDAMAHGLPVLASNVGAARAVIGDAGEHGWLVPPGDVPALTEAIHHVLTGPIEWPSLRRRCRAYVEERTLEAWAGRIGDQCAQEWGWTIINGRLRK
jgi:glycosyltransferase involved in cell wall biosynthesis